MISSPVINSLINNTNLVAPERKTFFSLWPESDTPELSTVMAVSGRREKWICLLDSSIDINISYILYVWIKNVPYETCDI